MRLFQSWSNKLATVIVLISICSAGILASTAQAYEKNRVYRFTVVELSDTHGHFWEDDLGQGGFAYIKTIVDQIRAEGNPVILLHAGDFNTGVPQSDLQGALPDIISFNAMGMDAIAAGNHEFDINIASMRRQQQLLTAPLLSANTSYTNPQTGKDEDFFKPYTLIKRGGLKFLVVGLTSIGTQWSANPKTVKHFKFYDPYASFMDTIAQATAEQGQPDVIIGLDHLGFYPLGLHGDEPYGDFTLAQKLPTRKIALLASANSPYFACVNQFGQAVFHNPQDACNVPYANLTPIINAFIDGLYVARADFKFKNGETTMTDFRLIPVNLKRLSPAGAYILVGDAIAPDPQLYKTLKSYNDELGDELKMPIGMLNRDLVIKSNHPSKFGTLVANAHRTLVGGDVGIINAGSLRKGLAKGRVTLLDMLRSEPYENSLVIVTMTGQELVDYIQQIIKYRESRYPLFGNIEFTVNPDNKTISQVTIGNKPLALQQHYKLVLSSFVAAGGDMYPELLEHDASHIQITKISDIMALRDYFMRHQVVDVDKLPIAGPRPVDN